MAKIAFKRLLARVSPARLRFQLLAFSIARMILNSGYRMLYPFLPTIARGLGVSMETAALAVTARSTLGLLGPLFGSTADNRGRKTAMLTGLVVFACGAILIPIWSTYQAFVVGLLLITTGKLIFDPAVQAYLGDRVDYARRGLAIAITEIGWSGAFLLGVPLVGLLIDRSGWDAPFPWLAVFGLVIATMLWRILPADAPREDSQSSLGQGFQTVLTHVPAMASLVVAVLISTGNEVVSIVFGIWMEDAFGLQIVALGAASMVIGLAELGGEGLVAGLSDRLGKRRAAGLGIGVNALMCLALPALGQSLGGALVGLFLFYISFEFTIVSLIPLMTELAPGARATLMASYGAAFSVGRAVGALIGPRLFGWGLLANGTTTALLDVAALAVLLLCIPPENPT